MLLSLFKKVDRSLIPLIITLLWSILFLENGLGAWWSVESTVGQKEKVKEKKDKMGLGQVTLQLIIASLLGTSLKNYGTFRVRKPFVSLLIPKKCLTLFLEISFGEEWKTLGSQVNIGLLSISCMRKLVLKSELKRTFQSALVVTLGSPFTHSIWFIY